ncbi:NAD(P)/FAD-dependent oxidoreductase [Sinimarinibacterium thermocellulolyticum]|uniref:FAD-dependent oxidoreductase n=1 Tax=Sinimarinibacterium thermocellulolyticum TaxID=3170016 RepID=A0ABV2A7E8_9GAMM
MKIAVIGSGIAGLSAAFFLARRHEVVLFEQDGRVGGHTHTIEVPTADGVQPVDTGWIVYNGVNYPNLTALFGELGVRTRPTSMSFGVSLNRGAYEWKGSDNLLTVFAQPANLLRLGHLRLLTEILRLNRVCNRLLRADALPGGSLGDFLRDAGFSAELQARYLLPMAGLIWSCSPRKAMAYPAADFMRFFDAHSLFTATQQPTWQTLIGGSHTYVKALLERYTGELRLNAAVTGLRRVVGGVEISTTSGSERFDRAVCAVHSDQALRLIGDGAGNDEREVLAGIPYNASRVVLHTDDSYLPRRRRAWASWNYINDAAFGEGVQRYTDVDFDREVHDRPISGSYWMNLLQGIAGPVNYVVTLNPTREIAPERIVYDTVYHHPHYGPDSVRTHRQLAGIQGKGGLWWAGAWTGYGFHEDGLVSGLRCVAGIDRDCLPAWASGV